MGVGVTAKTTLIRRAIADQLKTAIPGMNVTPFPDDTKPPRIVVNDDFDAIDYQFTLKNGQATVRYSLVVELAGTNATSTAERMEELLSWDGSESIYAALIADRTLGGVVDQCVGLSATRTPAEPDRAELPLVIHVSKT